MKLIGRSLVILLVSLLAACSPPKGSETESPSTVGYRLIDDNRPDEAIDHYQSLLETEPSNQEYLRGLSSAYALKGGFKIQMLLGPMKEMQDVDKSKKDFKKLLEKSLQDQPESESFKNAISTELELIVLMRKFLVVPTPTADEAEELKTSISILSSLKTPSQGDYLYMGILQSLLLKRELVQPLQTQKCSELVSEVQGRVSRVTSLYGKTLYFLSKSKPSERELYQKQLAQLDSMTAEISGLTTTSLLGLSFLDHAADSPQMRLLISRPECH